MAMKTLVLALAGLQLASALSVQPAAVPRTLVASGVEHTKTNATTCQSMQHRPSKVVRDLAEYKNQAQECLSWCGGYSSKCFKGCLNDCVGYLKAPPCASFVLSTDGCKPACDAMTPIYSCLKTVSAESTQDCHVKFGDAKVPESKCPF
mmetsp:Transcript_7411/g.21819  ORF Transcript_7411/g.21819 Transcript_7411/m.21819 type:complete len:149 (+) Transcript_7411:66-512(+)